MPGNPIVEYEVRFCLPSDVGVVFDTTGVRPVAEVQAMTAYLGRMGGRPSVRVRPIGVVPEWVTPDVDVDGAWTFEP